MVKLEDSNGRCPRAGSRVEARGTAPCSSARPSSAARSPSPSRPAGAPLLRRAAPRGARRVHAARASPCGRSPSTSRSTPTRSRSAPRARDRGSTSCTWSLPTGAEISCRPVTTLLETDHAHLARAIELGRARSRAREPQPARRRGRRRDGVISGGLPRRLRRAACRARGARRLRQRRLARRDDVRLARAVLPPGATPPCTDAIVEAGIGARRGRLRRPDREGLRPRPRDPSRRGDRGRVVDGERAARRAASTSRFESRPHRPPVGRSSSRQ